MPIPEFSPTIAARDRQLDWYARQIIDGNMSLADAIASHTRELWAIAEAYRRMAEDMVARDTHRTLYLCCPNCAPKDRT